MNLSFAPMEGLSYAEYRRIHARFFPGVDQYCAPFLAPDGQGKVKTSALKDLLPEGSRILRFQEAFELEETYPEDDAALEWVFYVAEGQRKELNISRLPEDTSLQRKMKAMIMKGRKPGAGKGVLLQKANNTF